MKDFDTAIKDYTEAIRLDPNRGGTYYNRGQAYHFKKDFDKAVKDYTEAVRLDPNLKNAPDYTKDIKK
jgi:tetratricopeptide (TPR) repeat protein